MTMQLLPKNPRRLLILVGVLIALVLGEQWYRHWRPNNFLTTEHYSIQSSATPAQTKEIGEVVEILYGAYVRAFTNFSEVRRPHPRLQLKLFQDRREFRRCHRGLGWAEAFYRKPYCQAYYSAREISPCHWMLHEAVHQLNHEVARWNVPEWIDEGVGEYFGTSTCQNGVLELGQIDRNTYPIWWLDDMDWSGDLEKDLANKEIIPLRAIVTGQGGPDRDKSFNLYYVEWWSLAHFLFQAGGAKYREPLFRVIREGGTLESFEKNIGPIDRIQAEWYLHLQEQKKLLHSVPIRKPGT
jgi:hypothetical protein